MEFSEKWSTFQHLKSVVKILSGFYKVLWKFHIFWQILAKLTTQICSLFKTLNHVVYECHHVDGALILAKDQVGLQCYWGYYSYLSDGWSVKVRRRVSSSLLWCEEVTRLRWVVSVVGVRQTAHLRLRRHHSTFIIPILFLPKASSFFLDWPNYLFPQKIHQKQFHLILQGIKTWKELWKVLLPF